MSKDNEYLKVAASAPNSLAQLPPLVRQIKDNALVVLLNCLDDLFSGCDDLFFDLSSRADSNNEQNLYFESMRELRVKKHGVISLFKQNLEQHFGNLTNNHTVAPPSPEQNNHNESFSLVQNDDLEQEVAVNGMTSKARVNCQEALYHLNTRLDHLIPSKAINANSNPLDPQQICSSFANACELFDINIKARIIIYKQFDRHVISRFSNIYTAANNLLIDAGILPKINATVQHRGDQHAPQSAAPSTSGLADEQQTSGSSYDLLELSGLLAAVRQIGSNPLSEYNNYSTNPGPTMPLEELLLTLSALQVKQPLAVARASTNLREVISDILSIKSPASPQALTQPDEDVINLVAMFFDFVLDDQALLLETQAFISRLQIPIVKVALHDKSFFNNGNHPARKLINTIASCSIGWDDSNGANNSKDKLFNQIQQIVQSVTENYVANIDIFSSQLEVLNNYLSQEEHKASLVEKRTSQAIEGQARTQKAKETAQKLLFEKLEKIFLPSEISNFLTDQWLQLLIIVHLKNGEESPEWLDAVQLADDLTWVCHTHTDTKSQERLSKIVPNILSRINEGVSRVSSSADDIRNCLTTLERTLSSLQTTGERPPLQPLSAVQAIALGHTPGSGSKSWQEMTALERQQARFKSLTYEYIKKAESIPLGTWFNYEDRKTSKTLRCKLTSRVEASDSYVFVNRFGFKVLNVSRKEFAYDMQQQQATPLEGGLIFDRAMSRIIEKLKQAETP